MTHKQIIILSVINDRLGFLGKHTKGKNEEAVIICQKLLIDFLNEEKKSEDEAEADNDIQQYQPYDVEKGPYDDADE